MKVFIDTNIVLNMFLNRDDKKSEEVVIFLIGKGMELFINGISIINTNYILKKYISDDERTDYLRFMLERFEIAGNSKAIFLDALESDFSDFEDGVQYFSGLSVSCDLIITDDRKGFQPASIPVYTAVAFHDTFI